LLDLWEGRYFYTPNGLKIRISVPYAFALLARLRPKVRPEEALFLTEGLDLVGSLLGRVMFLVALGKHASLGVTVMMVAGGTLLGRMITNYGIFIVPGISWVARLYAAVPWYLSMAVPALPALWMMRWSGLWRYIIASVVGLAVDFCLDMGFMTVNFEESGMMLSGAEASFINAYRLKASSLGMSTSVDVDEEELQTGKWQEALEDYLSYQGSRLYRRKK